MDNLNKEMEMWYERRQVVRAEMRRRAQQKLGQLFLFYHGSILLVSLSIHRSFHLTFVCVLFFYFFYFSGAESLIRMAELSENLPNASKKPLRREAKALGRKKWYRNHFQNYKVGGERGLPLLHHAATQGKTFLCELLIEELHVDVNSKDRHGATALHHAVLEGKVAFIQKLLENVGTDINAKDDGRLTPFHLSIMRANDDVMHMLVDRASIDEDSCYGSPIHAAAFLDNVAAVKACLEHGADRDQVLYGFCNPLVAAVFGSSHGCVALLVQDAQVTVKPLLYKVAAAADSSENDCLAMIQLLVDAGADANAVDADLDEEPAIICAAKRGRSQIVEFLLERTIPIQGVTWTPDGLIRCVNAEDFKNLDTVKKAHRINKLRSKMLQELEAKKFLSAKMLLLALKLDMDNENWELHEALCNLHIGNASSCSYFVFSAKSFYYLGRSYLSATDHHHAEIAIKAALALDPNNPEYRGFLE